MMAMAPGSRLPASTLKDEAQQGLRRKETKDLTNQSFGPNVRCLDGE